jgi:hypothetical protein
MLGKDAVAYRKVLLERTYQANRTDGLRQEFGLGTFRIKAGLITTFVSQMFQNSN